MNQNQNDEADLQAIMALWQGAKGPDKYTRISLLLPQLAGLISKHAAATSFARQKRDEILQTIRSEAFLGRLRGDSDLRSEEDVEYSILVAIQPGLLIHIFLQLNSMIGETSASMVYYDEASASPGLTDELDRLFWDYWFETKRWHKIVNMVQRRGWFSHPLPKGESGDFIRKAADIFGALVLSGDFTRAAGVLEGLAGQPSGSEKRFAMKQIRKFWREDAPANLQERINQLANSP